MIDRISKKCTGCGACASVCPAGAIHLSLEQSLFYEPVVDGKCCTGCRKCVEVCPALEFRSGGALHPKAWALAAEDGIRRDSSSGGVFTILARRILEKGGVVCGVAWDNHWNARHILVEDEEGLARLRRSKYVQSDTGTVFAQIGKILESGREVLFSGTPCQVAGVTKCLGKKREGLTTIDVLCHGAPSPKIWRDYLEENFGHAKIRDIRFRSKENGWMGCRSTIQDTRGAYIDDGEKKPMGVFLQAFLDHRISNECCMDCAFRHVPRPGDFTMGDFWFHHEYGGDLNDGKGLSILLLNTPKAERLFGEVRGSFVLARPVDLKGHWEHIEVTERTRDNDARRRLFAEYGKHGTTKSLQLACGRGFDVALLSFFNGMNYGSALVAYAQNQMLAELGCTVLHIHKPYNFDYPYTEKNAAWVFARNHYWLTRFFKREESCRELNAAADAFIVGSDTQWWWSDVSECGGHHWLDFVESGKKKLSFCTSFAKDKAWMPNAAKVKLRWLYRRFDGLSTREESGRRILTDDFGVESVCFADPTLMIDRQYFDALAADSRQTEGRGYVVAYILDWTEEKGDCIQRLSDRLGVPAKVIPRMARGGGYPKWVERGPCAIEDFVWFHKHATFVVTDSFHGVCLSLVFDRPFAAFVNQARGGARYGVFFEQGLQDHFVAGAGDVERALAACTDYSAAKVHFAQIGRSAKEWLKEKLAEPNRPPDKVDLLYDYFLHEFPKRPLPASASASVIQRCVHFFRSYKKVALGVALLGGLGLCLAAYWWGTRMHNSFSMFGQP